jgi:hypothetical protein
MGYASWKDKARAYDIAHFFGGSNPRPDVVGFQEIWDEDLFLAERCRLASSRCLDIRTENTDGTLAR